MYRISTIIFCITAVCRWMRAETLTACIWEEMLSRKRISGLCRAVARRAWSKEAKEKDRDFMWYLWCGRKSPLSGRNTKTFERTYVLDESTWYEESNPYYKFYEEEKVAI